MIKKSNVRVNKYLRVKDNVWKGNNHGQMLNIKITIYLCTNVYNTENLFIIGSHQMPCNKRYNTIELL